ncbi:hypothetical protein [Streptomyces uncialis]|uniref:hypothetical protein n=1 Tax=Streptomyces uncialis TaxID=1048205 RepID=UPI0037A8EB2D
MATNTGASSLEAGVEPGRTLDRPEARREALQFSLRARRASPRSELWRHGLRETRAIWYRLVGPDGQDPTPEGS